MFLHWNQNGTQRIWNLSEKNINRKLRKALKRNVEKDSNIYQRLCAAITVADMHCAIYGLIGTPEFTSFEIKSEPK